MKCKYHMQEPGKASNNHMHSDSKKYNARTDPLDSEMAFSGTHRHGTGVRLAQQRTPVYCPLQGNHQTPVEATR